MFKKLLCVCLVVVGLATTGTAVASEALWVNFRQAATYDGSNGYALGDIHWISSIIQASNSVYYEGMTVHQRALFVNIPATTGNIHSLSFKHQFTKGGIHGYDFLTSWDQGIADNETALGVPILINQCGEEIGPPADMSMICDALHSGGNFYDVEAPDDPFISKDGSTADRIAAYEACAGNRTIRVWGDQPILSGSLTVEHDVPYGGDTLDSYTECMLVIETTSTQLAIEMGGHLGVSGDPLIVGTGWGDELGASWISGGPYHFQLLGVGGPLDVNGDQTEYISLGAQDNQIKGADILRLPPVCEVFPAVDSTCAHSSATFAVRSTGGTPPYSWVWMQSPYMGPALSTDSVLTIPSATLADAGEYRVVVTDILGLTDTCYAYLTVLMQPVCTLECPAMPPVCGSSGNTLTASTGGPAPVIAYDWSLDGGGWFITGGYGTPTVTYTAGNSGTVGTFGLVVTDLNGCMDTCMVECECAASCVAWHVSTTGDDSTGDGSAGFPFATIQHAIDQASACDTVLVACGTYNEHDIVMKSGVVLRSETGLPDCVTIDADSVGRAFNCDSLDETTVIEGFTMTGGAPGSHGGAMLLLNSSPTITSCNILNNSTAAPGYDGGGIYLRDSSYPTITGCMISGNATEDKGGGIFCRNNSEPTITRCVIANNAAATKGGGLYCYNGCIVTVDSCTFYGNSGSDGGGIAGDGNSQVTADNTIISFSTGGEAVYCDSTSSARLSCCDVWGNIGGDWVGCIAGQGGIRYNFSANPMFCDPDSLDFRLWPLLSPCLDAPGCGLVGALGEGCEDVSSVGCQAADPVNLELLTNRPNPSNPATQIVFSMAEPARAVLSIYDAAGRRIAVLADRRYDHGTYDVVWDGTDSTGNPVSAGIYFCRLRAGDRVAIQKIVLVR